METKNPGMEKNLLLAFLLTGVVLAVSQYFLKPPITAEKAAPKQHS